MSKSRSAFPAKSPAPAPATPPRPGPIRSWVSFWFTPADPLALHVLRLLAGVVFLAWLLPFAGQQAELFGLQGWFDRQAYSQAARLDGGPPQPISWSLLYLCGSNPGLLTAAYWLSVAVLVLFTLGVWPRLTAILAWVVIASFTANPALVSDADALVNLLAFYLMIGYVLLGLRNVDRPLASRLMGAGLVWPLRAAPAEGPQSLAANLAWRCLQVHFAVAMVASGLHKLQFGEWWGGTALWYVLHPPTGTAQEPGSQLGLLSFAAYVVLAWQFGFPFFAWRPRWRPVLLGGAVAGWLGTALMYELPAFGPALFVGCLSYVRPEGWHRLLSLLARVPGLRGLAHSLPVPVDGPAKQGGKREALHALPL